MKKISGSLNSGKRYMPLLDEIRMHVYQWATDPDWKKIPPAINIEMTRLMNAIRIAETMKSLGISDEGSDDKKRKKFDFIAIFKRRHLETIDMRFSEPITPVNQVNIDRTIENIENEGGSYEDFLEWFFCDFCSLEANKRFMPPQINFACSKTIVNKYLYVMKDELRLKKKQMNTVAVNNMLLGIALPMAERTKDADFIQKVQDFSKERMTASKFFSLMKVFAEKLGDKETMEACARIEANRTSNRLQERKEAFKQGNGQV